MKADLDADRAGEIEREEEPERDCTGPADVPGQDEGGERPQGRHHHHGQRDAPMPARIGARSPDMRLGARFNSTATMMRSLPPISAAKTAFEPCRSRSSAIS